MSEKYETVAQIMAERDQLRAELSALKAGQSDAVVEVVSAYGDPEAFGEREIKALTDLSKIPYGTRLYTAPNGVIVPLELAKRLCPKLDARHWHQWNASEAYQAACELRALLQPQEVKS